MHYVYIIKSINSDEIYVGCATDVVKRIKEHNLGLSFHTRKYLPWKPVYLEGYAHKEDAFDREKKLKQFGRVYSQLKRRIWRSLKS